jgi:hypothetical protein
MIHLLDIKTIKSYFLNIPLKFEFLEFRSIPVKYIKKSKVKFQDF